MGETLSAAVDSAVKCIKRIGKAIGNAVLTAKVQRFELNEIEVSEYQIFISD